MNTVSIIALVVSGCMFLIALATFIVNGVRNGKNDVKTDEARLNDINQSLLKVNMKLDQVCTTTSEIRTDIKTIQNRQLEHTEQITVLQERINTAFLRIDELRKDVQDLQKGV